MKRIPAFILGSLVLMFLLAGCGSPAAVITPATGQTITATQTSAPSITPTVAATATATATSTSMPTATKSLPTPTQTPEVTCVKPQDIQVSDKGKVLEVCGVVTGVGTVPCAECANGSFSYILFDSEFQIITYEWIFNKERVGLCLRVKDEVETLNGKPVFVLGSNEGYDNSPCTINAAGVPSCELDYFQSCP